MHWNPAFLINEDGAERKYRTKHSHPVAGSPSPTHAVSTAAAHISRRSFLPELTSSRETHPHR
jgi:hypothetical protein